MEHDGNRLSKLTGSQLTSCTSQPQTEVGGGRREAGFTENQKKEKSRLELFAGDFKAGQ